MSESVTNKENETKVVGFKVSDREHTVLKQYADIFYNQMIEDTDIRQHRRLLEKPNIGDLIWNATYAYLMQYQYIMQKQEEQKQQDIRWSI